MGKGKVLKRSILFLIALVFLLSIAKNLKLYNNNNVIKQMVSNDNTKKDMNTNQEEQSKPVNTNDPENNVNVSINPEGVPVLLQKDQIQNDYYGYVINNISKSKKLGDFQNPYDILGHVDKQGNTEGPYSYLIINVTIECYQEFPQLYLNTLRMDIYKGEEFLQGYEALTSNNNVSMSTKSGMRCIMKKGELKNINIVYLVDDKCLDDTDIYLFINNTGASFGDDVKNKKLVKLNTEGVLQ